ncbi:MAG: N-6 DNA methylase [Spirochaetes bacterium]|nr:N-6 DNA methylase [Spirochaetota bacterium]
MLNKYISNLKEKYNTKDYLEHTYRTPFENLLKDFIEQEIKKDFIIIQEPRRETFGAPDFKIVDKINNVIGYIECKDINIDIIREVKSKQIEKYLSITDNLIFTNYIDFILFKNKQIYKKCSIVDIFDLEKNKVIIANENELKEILKQFFLSKPVEIKDSEKLSIELAGRTKILKDLILEELNEHIENPFIKFFNIFNKTIINDLRIENFADMYAQIIGIGLLFLRLSKNENITKDNLLTQIPKYIPLLKDFFPNVSFDEWDRDILWILDDIICLINSIDKDFIKNALSYKNMSLIEKRDTNLKDPFIHFYELFLTIYDKKLKADKGVFYTPESVVSFIIRSLDIILKERLLIKDGFVENKLKVLDFASGTGTFILALIDYIKISLLKTGKKTLFDSEIREHILENVYGFEILVVPYIISHLRIHEYLESNNFVYDGNKKERAEIYLTNTLNNEKAGQTNFFTNIDEEANLADKVKNDADIMVIMGNPPYSNYSQNKAKDDKNKLTWIGNLIEEYKPKGEKKINLDDDYIKFIRFACWKLQSTNKGVIGIITNNSFLNGITHRKMRKILLNSFDEIYIYNLHGNGNIGEVCPDGSPDNNVFDIKDAGVSINFFIKKDNKPDKSAKLFYSELFGKQKDKYNFLYDNDINSIKFIEVDYKDFNDEFSKTKWGNTFSDVGDRNIKLFDDGLNFFVPNNSTDLIKTYGNFWGMKDIFNFSGTSIKTERDFLTIHFNKENIKKVVKDFIDLEEEKIRDKYKIQADSRDWKIILAKKDLIENKEKDCYKIIQYRPFDFRHTFYTGKSKGFIGTPGYDVASNFYKNNIGLIFKRQFKSDKEFSYSFITDKITEGCLFESAYANNSCAPLYLYSEDDIVDNNGKETNFTEDFKRFIDNKYANKAPEEIFYYIYAILYSPTYRKKYNELLKIDFPRIPFTENVEIFDKISEIGERLTNLHLLKVNPNRDIVKFECDSQDYTVRKAEFSDNKIWINDSVYFDNVPEKVWKYFLGGYQVLKKWLEYRKEASYTLTNSDLKHFMNVVNVINETLDIHDQIDNLTKDWI